MTVTTDLTQEIIHLLDTGQTSAPVTLDHASLGGAITADTVTISFPDPPGLTFDGSAWTGEVDVSAASASLSVGGGLTATIDGDAAKVIPGLSGKYMLTAQPGTAADRSA